MKSKSLRKFSLGVKAVALSLIVTLPFLGLPVTTIFGESRADTTI